MSAKSPAMSIEPYLPAGLPASSLPGPVERLLTAPYRRIYAAWLDE